MTVVNGIDETPSVEPTKDFFVDMITRDIALEQAVLDLVDNCVDGAKKIANDGGAFENHSVALVINGSEFSIKDNCGGFGKQAAIDYAFRFGRPPSAARTPGSIGQFGVGMKRALFKFAEHFIVRSATTEEEWAIAVDVLDWQTTPDWHFPWSDFGSRETISTDKPGTEVIVDKLRPDVATRFATTNFSNLVIEHIRTRHRQFISQGLAISVNGFAVQASDILLLVTDELQPARDEFVLTDEGEAEVQVRIVTGVGASQPRDAGWYVICNGRVVLSADRRPTTGWGLYEEESERLIFPSFHNQYARFRGIIWFDSTDSARVPWNTTKTDVQMDSSVWQRAFTRMVEMSRPVLGFLNELDNDIDENTRDSSPLLQYVSQASLNRAERFTGKRAFSSPSRTSVRFKPKTVKIQYSRLIEDVNFLRSALDVSSAKAVGERTFDIALEMQREE